jgi:tetratricopeptide (TPR) repeat protein
VAHAAPQENVKDVLGHAQALYYEARFADSIQLLTRVNDALRGKPDMLPEKIATKLQLALAHIGLNQTAEAKSFLLELYALDPEYSLDPRQFSPKVIELAGIAKAEQNKIRCQTAVFDARKHLESGNAGSLLTLIDTMKPGCKSLGAIEPEAAELFYRTGLGAYKRNEFSAALNHFKTAVRLAPNHELAAQYIDLTQSKLQVADDRMLLQWQKNFDTGQLKLAAADYRQIMSGESNPQIVNHITSEYLKALSTLVDSWNRACPTGDETALGQIRSQISELLPNPAFGEDVRGKMAGNCSKPVVREPEPIIVAATPSPAPTPEIALNEAAKTTPATTCLSIDPQSALTRLKSKVDPVIPIEARSYLRNYSQIVVRVKTRIDEIGNIISADVQGSNHLINNAVRSAVTAWKFTPARDQTGLRCVDTEFPITISIK